MRLLDISIERFKMPQVLGLKFIDFEFKGNKALEFTVEKEQIDKEVTVANLQTVLLSQEGEVSTEFKDEISEIVDKRSFQVVLRVIGLQIDEIEDITIAKDSSKRFRMVCLGEFSISKTSALKDATVDLTI
jgi:hypothetical protein